MHVDLLEGLHDPASYPGELDEVTVIETHISRIFFAGSHVYKVKKPVDFGFLDFTTLERRKHFCEEELRLNRRLAPDTYRGVVPIVRRPDGSIAVGAEGEVIEWAVEMFRLPADRMLDHLLDEGAIDNQLLRDLATVLVNFHACARAGPEVDAYATPSAVECLIADNFEGLRSFERGEGEHACLDPALLAFLERRALAFQASNRAVLEHRVRESRIREGHGDLHAGNICATGDGLVIYDCIEFSERFRCADVACDLAFLAMDLDDRGFAGFAGYLSHCYAERAQDPGLVALMPFYKGYRALVRAKVACLSFQGGAGEAKRLEALRYLHLACAYELPQALILMTGLPASGKSYLGKHLARPLDAAVLSSDVRRKILAGLPVHSHRKDSYESGLYTPELKERTYQSLCTEAENMLVAGRTVIVDATFSKAHWRAPFLEAAERRGVPCFVVHVTASEAVVQQRMDERAADPRAVSDADWNVYLSGRDSFEAPSEIAADQLLELESSDAPVEDLAHRAFAFFAPGAEPG